MSNVPTELPASVIDTDRKLDKAHTLSTEALFQHRWHWTLDETNPARVSCRAYAAAIGVTYSQVTRQAKAYSVWQGEESDSSLWELYARASVGAEKEAAIDAVAAATGATFQTAKISHADVVKRTRARAQDRAERRGTSVEAELPDAAATEVWAKQAAKAVNDAAAARRAAAGWQLRELEGHVASAHRHLKEALKVSGDALSDEMREWITADLGKLRATLELIDMRISGTVDVDWDAEAAKLIVRGA